MEMPERKPNHCQEHDMDYPTYLECPCCETKKRFLDLINNQKIVSKLMQLEVKDFLNKNIPLRFKDSTFLNYITKHEKQKKAVKEIEDFIKDFKNTGLILIGSTGTGKTHLCYAIIKSYLEKYSIYSYWPRIIKLSELIRAFKDNWQSKQRQEQKIVDEFSNCKLLIINEVGVQFSSETEKQYLTEIIDNRYEKMYPTILVGNLTLPEISKIVGDRIIDRFREDGKVLVFDWESYRKA